MALPVAATRRRLASDLDLLSPTLKAYLFGLLSVTLPRAVALLIAALRGKAQLSDALRRVVDALRRQAGVDRFPFACGLVVFGASCVPRLVERLLCAATPGPSAWTRRRAAALTFLSTLAAAVASFRLLNGRPTREERFVAGRRLDDGDSGVTTPAADKGPLLERPARSQLSAAAHVELAGRTLDLTFFGVVRAADVGVSMAWSRSKARPRARARSLVERAAAPTLFAVSSCIVMWTWFYAPHQLPPSYRAWISSAAQIDDRLPQALREIRYGSFVYGRDTGRAALLGDMCRDLGMPEAWGDPAKTVPIPCEMYHCGTGKNCEWHGLSRFARAWQFAMRMYVPLNLALLLRRPLTAGAVQHALLEASRSSAFLGAFVALFYYGVCLGRTRIGPLLMKEDGDAARQYLEGGPNVATGCALCGWSILLEKAARRQEMAFFVAPRALATLFPRRYERKDMWREEVAFALSAATLLTAAQHSPRRVRGVFGRVLASVLG